MGVPRTSLCEATALSYREFLSSIRAVAKFVAKLCSDFLIVVIFCRLEEVELIRGGLDVQ